MKSNFKSILIFAALMIVAVLIAGMLIRNSSGTRKKIENFSEVVEKFENNQVEEFYILKDNTLVLKDTAAVEYTYKLRDIAIFINQLKDTVDKNKESGVLKKYDYQPIPTYPVWVSWIPIGILLIGVGVMYFLFTRQIASGSGGFGKMNSFGKAKLRLGSDEKKRVYFSDVAGADEEKEELREVVEYLKDVKKYTKLGARIPRGILLVGPPGTGKTLLAKAVAGEAGVPFYSISGSDFVEMYVGVGASRVRDLFDTARKNNASIIFIDEIDAVGRHRGAGLGGGHDEREQTLNQLLVEMDGFGTHEGVIVMAATNRPDILDPALLRPGRFDRQITVNYPDMKGRLEILKVHAKNKPFEENVDLEKIAQTTVGFTGADLANLLNEAALLAARKGKSLIGQNDLEDAALRQIVGTRKTSKQRLEFENKVTAYHEAGHAVVSYYLPNVDKVTYITIVPAGNAGGFTLLPPEKDLFYYSKTKMEEEIVVNLGGRVAEMLIFNDLSTGASGDLKTSTSRARAMVTKYGMSEKLGSVVYEEHSNDEIFLGRDFSSSKPYSEKTAAEIDSEIKRIIDEAYERCEMILSEHRDKLEFVAQYLLKHETMDGDQFEAAMSGNPTFEELEEINAEKRRKSEEENKRREELEEEARKRDAEAAEKRRHSEADKFTRPDHGMFTNNPQDSDDSHDEEGQ